MKSTILYLLLFTYSINILKPVLPVIADCAAHMFWYSEHVATVHFENGKYHVHNEMIDAAKKNVPEQNQQNQKKEVSQDEYLVAIKYSLPVVPPVTKKFYPILLCAAVSSGPSTDFPPPRI